MSLLACVFLVPGAYSIEVGFSAENGGESTDLSSSYDVDTGVSVSEESTASFDQPAIENTRSVSGTGDINAVQTYSGSGGYAGSATLSSQGVSGSLKGNAILTPQSLTASQDLSLSGNSVDTGMSLANEGDSADFTIAISSGMIDSSQGIQTGSVFNDISASCTAPWAQIKQQTSFKGIKDSTTTIFDNPISISKASVFNLNANSNTGGATGCITGSGNLDVGKKATNAEVKTIVKFAESYKYSFTTNPGELLGLTLDVDNAESIYAQAYASNKMGGYSGKGVEITKGSLHGYENRAYSDETRATSDQKFREAFGDNIRINQKIDPTKVGLSGYASTSYAEINSNAFIQGYSNYGHTESIAASTYPGSKRTTSDQSINYAEGVNIEVGTQAINNLLGESSSVITKVDKYGSGKGNIFLYSDKSENYALIPTEKMGWYYPLIGHATSSADINAVGTSIDVKANAANTKDILPKGFLQNNKLSASIGVKAESNQDPVLTNKEEYKGLAIMAVQSKVLPLDVAFDPGHAGVGIWNDDGTWTIGSLQAGPQWNPLKIINGVYLGGALVVPGADNNGWGAHDLTWLEVTALLSSSEKEKHSIEGYKVDVKGVCTNTRPGDAYDKIKIIKVDDPNPVQANNVIDDFKNRGFWFATTPPSVVLNTLNPKKILTGDKYWFRLTNDCLDATVEALKAYGAKDLPIEIIIHMAPNDYLAHVKGNEYLWNSDWKTFDLAKKVTDNTHISDDPDLPCV